MSHFPGDTAAASAPLSERGSKVVKAEDPLLPLLPKKQYVVVNEKRVVVSVYFVRHDSAETV